MPDNPFRILDTTATKKIFSLKKRIRAICGGTAASKTVSILIWCIDYAQSTKNELISVVSESYPHLSGGAMRDFEVIMKDRGYWKDSRWVKNPRTVYTFETGSQIEFVSVDTYEKAHGPRRDVLFLNECFPAGTQVDGRNIEDIKIGDFVSTCNIKTGKIERKKVLSTLKKPSPENLWLLNTSCSLIIGTYNHPVMTQVGWKRLNEIKNGDFIYELPLVQERGSGVEQGTKDKSKETQQGLLLKSLFWKVSWAKKQRKGDRPELANAVEEGYRKEFTNAKRAGDNAYLGEGQKQTWWKWTFTYCFSRKFINEIRSWLGRRTTDKDRDRDTSIPLHGRLGESVLYGGGGVRRTESPFKAYKKERLNKDSVLGKVRVESNKVLERKDFEQFGFSDGGDYVYCLETEDNHTFFANSILVHNCNNIPYPIVDQLITRTRKTIWMDWNPVEDFWFDEKMQGQRDDIDFITLTYLDNEAIDEGTLNEIMAHRNDLNWWKVYALGQKGELVTRIYKDWQLIDEIPHEARLERHWLDFGYTNDPTAIGDMYYYNGGYILDEQLYQKGLSNKQIADFLLNLKKALTIADSAEPKSIAEISSYGVQIVGANKKNKGRENTYNAWAIGVVQAEKMSVTKRSINLLKEYRNYLWQTDRDGRIINEPIDMWNHHLDGIKYAMTSLAPVIRNREIYETMPRLIMPYDRPKNPAR